MDYSAVNTIWVLLGAALVFFMQAGFAMVETGFTRAKNAGNIKPDGFLYRYSGFLAGWLWNHVRCRKRLLRKNRWYRFRSKLWQCNAS